MDGGSFWSRATKKCVATCEYYNETAKICESFDDTTNCPFFTLVSDQKICNKSCGNYFSIDENAVPGD